MIHCYWMICTVLSLLTFLFLFWLPFASLRTRSHSINRKSLQFDKLFSHFIHCYSTSSSNIVHCHCMPKPSLETQLIAIQPWIWTPVADSKRNYRHSLHINNAINLVSLFVYRAQIKYRLFIWFFIRLVVIFVEPFFLSSLRRTQNCISFVLSSIYLA